MSKADIDHNQCAGPLQTRSGRSGFYHCISALGQKRKLMSWYSNGIIPCVLLANCEFYR